MLPKPKSKPPKPPCYPQLKNHGDSEGHRTGTLMIGLVGAAIVAGMIYFS